MNDLFDLNCFEQQQTNLSKEINKQTKKNQVKTYLYIYTIEYISFKFLFSFRMILIDSQVNRTNKQKQKHSHIHTNKSLQTFMNLKRTSSIF